MRNGGVQCVTVAGDGMVAGGSSGVHDRGKLKAFSAYWRTWMLSRARWTHTFNNSTTTCRTRRLCPLQIRPPSRLPAASRLRAAISPQPLSAPVPLSKADCVIGQNDPTFRDRAFVTDEDILGIHSFRDQVCTSPTCSARLHISGMRAQQHPVWHATHDLEGGAGRQLTCW